MAIMDSDGEDTQLRWPLADDERDGQTSLFGVDEALTVERGTGRMSDLEFLHVTAKRIINEVPGSSPMPFRWTINAYRGCSHSCLYCFARPTHDYLGLGIGEDFDRKIVVKVNAVDKLRSELRSPRWAGEGIAMGTNTDPYQRAEGKYRLTRGIVQALGEAANPFSILTKSSLVLRDLDVLTTAATRTKVNVSFSIGTLDEKAWRATEPGTPNPRRRIDAVRALVDAGIDVGVLIAPILPGTTDTREQLTAVIDAVIDAGASSVTALALHLRPGVREHYLAWLATYDTDLHARYLKAYADGSTIDSAYRQWLTATTRSIIDSAVRRRRTQSDGQLSISDFDLTVGDRAAHRGLPAPRIRHATPSARPDAALLPLWDAGPAR
ncbi:MAG: Radical protein [Jatrophihabitantaceae bacterium]|nr:Radical protein [Jatrophihabitantaceae bacterium]